jgi:hypothetical protein
MNEPMLTIHEGGKAAYEEVEYLNLIDLAWRLGKNMDELREILQNSGIRPIKRTIEKTQKVYNLNEIRLFMDGKMPAKAVHASVPALFRSEKEPPQPAEPKPDDEPDELLTTTEIAKRLGKSLREVQLWKDAMGLEPQKTIIVGRGKKKLLYPLRAFYRFTITIGNGKIIKAIEALANIEDTAKALEAINTMKAALAKAEAMLKSGLKSKLQEANPLENLFYVDDPVKLLDFYTRKEIARRFNLSYGKVSILLNEKNIKPVAWTTIGLNKAKCLLYSKEQLTNCMKNSYAIHCPKEPPPEASLEKILKRLDKLEERL